MLLDRILHLEAIAFDNTFHPESNIFHFFASMLCLRKTTCNGSLNQQHLPIYLTCWNIVAGFFVSTFKLGLQLPSPCGAGRAPLRHNSPVGLLCLCYFIDIVLYACNMPAKTDLFMGYQTPGIGDYLSPTNPVTMPASQKPKLNSPPMPYPSLTCLCPCS